MEVFQRPWLSNGPAKVIFVNKICHPNVSPKPSKPKIKTLFYCWETTYSCVYVTVLLELRQFRLSQCWWQILEKSYAGDKLTVFKRWSPLAEHNVGIKIPLLLLPKYWCYQHCHQYHCHQYRCHQHCCHQNNLGETICAICSESYQSFGFDFWRKSKCQ